MAYANAQPEDSIPVIRDPFTFNIGSTLLYTDLPPVYYYPFYNGVQLIEVDYYSQSLAEGRHLDMVQPRGGSWYDDALRMNRPNGYLLRDEQGKIVRNFGVENVRKLHLRPPDEAPVRTHKSRFDSSKQKGLEYSVYSGYAPLRMYGYAYIYRDEDMSYTLIDTLGVVRLEKYPYISYADSCYVVMKDNRYGLFDADFKQRIPFKYHMLQLIDDNTFLANDGKYTFINKDDELLDTTHYANIYYPTRINGLFVYRVNDYKGKCGLMDRKLNRITPPIYAWVETLQGKGYFATDSTRKMAVLNDRGQQITPFKYEQRLPYWRQDGYWLVAAKDSSNYRLRYGVLDTNGRELLPTKYDAIDPYYEGHTVASLEGFKALINEQGEVLTPFEYQHIGYLGQQYYVVRKTQDSSGVVDGTGKLVVPIEYKTIHCVGDSMAFVSRQDNKKGFVHLHGGEGLPFEYDGGSCFVEGRAMVRQGQRAGLIDKTGKEYTGFEYDVIFSYNEGQWLVRKDTLFGAIDKYGKVIIPLEYRSIQRLSDGGIKFINRHGMRILGKDEK